MTEPAKIEERIQNWLSGPFDLKTKEGIRRLQSADPKALNDAFFKDLSFGTGGMRGVMGIGTNRMNIYTIQMATQGLADYIKKQPDQYEDVVRVCQAFEIPYYTVNFVQEYRDNVFAQFLADYKAGLTPNPDVLCNREIKFKVFLEKAMDLGADFLATGHYCRLDDQARLLKGSDPDKDQSYFLHAVSQAAFRKVLFPVGHLTKKEVRTLARQHNLATAEKKDSTGICFIGKRDFKPFLSQYVAIQPGNFETLDGQIVGQHDGSAFYTLGQRKGMGLGGEGDAWYVARKDPARNVVFVVRGANHPALFTSELIAQNLTWVAEPPPPTTPIAVQPKSATASKNNLALSMHQA